MKLFLSSTSIPDELVTPFTELVGKDLEDISFALIENAADPYGDNVGFVLETRAVLQSLENGVSHHFLASPPSSILVQYRSASRSYQSNHRFHTEYS